MQEVESSNGLGILAELAAKLELRIGHTNDRLERIERAIGRQAAQPAMMRAHAQGVMPASGTLWLTPDVNAPEQGRYWMLRAVKALGSDPSKGGAATSVGIQTIAINNPAAGTDWATGVPANTTWQVIAIDETLQTSVAAAGRVPRIVFGTSIVGVAPNTQAASLSETYVFGTGLASDAVGSTPAQNTAPLPIVTLGPGTTIGSSTLNLQAADQYSNISITVIETTVTLGLSAAMDFYVGTPPGPGMTLGQVGAADWHDELVTFPGSSHYSRGVVPVLASHAIYAGVTGGVAGALFTAVWWFEEFQEETARQSWAL